MIRIGFVLILVLRISNLLSHSPNEAHFSIYEDELNLLVDAEFPWTISKAVFLYDSSLNLNPSHENIHESLLSYVKENFIILNLSGDTIELKEVVNLQNQGHHEKYQFIFQKGEVSLLRNTLMFNFSDKQKNYHTFTLEDLRKEFQLDKLHPEFLIQEKKPVSFVPFLGLIVVMTALLVIFLRKRAKAS